MKEALFFVAMAVILFMSSCTPTQERLRAERQIANRTELYSQQAGTLYRNPPVNAPIPDDARAMANLSLSYNPFEVAPTIVATNRGKMMPGKPRARRIGPGQPVYYSPYTGETYYIDR